jgi:hypothetical protein
LSEHQYYEFRAIDRPLDAAAQRALRQLSSRATITDRSFVNEYQWGDFRGDPRHLMEKWFDLFIYWANWGSRTVMWRVPRRHLDPKALEEYAVEDTVDLWMAGDSTLVCFNRPNEEPIDGLLPKNLGNPLTALRNEVLLGDRRVFYLGWLVGVMEGTVQEDVLEPPCPSGLTKLPASLKTFARFFDLDEDLIAAAATGDASPQESKQPRRTARQLAAAAEVQAEQREQREAKRSAAGRARRDREAQRELDVRLDSLKPRVEAAWQEVEALSKTSLPKDYDRALEQLKDLAQLADRDGEREAFDRRLSAFRDRYGRRRTLLARLDRAGLTAKPD